MINGTDYSQHTVRMMIYVVLFSCMFCADVMRVIALLGGTLVLVLACCGLTVVAADYSTRDEHCWGMPSITTGQLSPRSPAQRRLSMLSLHHRQIQQGSYSVASEARFVRWAQIVCTIDCIAILIRWEQAFINQ